MTERLAYLWPELSLFVATCVVMVLGLSPSRETRRLCAWVSAIGLLVAAGLAANAPIDSEALLPHLMPFAKLLIALVGLVLLMLLAGTVDRDYEAEIASGRAVFNALRSNRAEFYSFFLFSLTGLMLTASAESLIWLFLALELTSLPTYVMVTISTRGTQSQEAGVKYFFLGALGAAFFLYGFALIYGGTGATHFADIAGIIATEGMNPILTLGMILGLIGVSFKIAAVPMHFYTPDVYQGAAASVSAMLAFVPKTAGFLAIIVLCALMGWRYGPGGESLPEAVRMLLWISAALTMTVGNTLALRQRSVKRLLAYSSIAHSGYMLVGVVAGPGSDPARFTTNGIAAVLFYLLCYGFMNVGAFAVLAALRRPDGTEADDIDDIRGLCHTQPLLGWSMVLCALSLLGMPPLLGFIGKFGLFTSAISAGEIVLVVILGLNSAVAAAYYLRLVVTPYLERPPERDAMGVQRVAIPSRPIVAVVSACSVVVLVLAAQFLVTRSAIAGRVLEARPPASADARP
ncbi:MAG: NADH-quinone oxidoreductase subunit N [Leptolyngbya sp. PLA3]|nr:MAG: NADH-quinone oxidoreductase subunit N [Cyanobacteria bacterium CYA]MCE7967183.1 NADH-quinone oxidoreductase subunit N [Leptolyngbya sp. PL-A3]